MDHDEAPANPLVTAVARSGQIAIRFGELRAVLCLYGIADRLDGVRGIGNEIHGIPR